MRVAQLLLFASLLAAAAAIDTIPCAPGLTLAGVNYYQAYPVFVNYTATPDFDCETLPQNYYASAYELVNDSLVLTSEGNGHSGTCQKRLFIYTPAGEFGIENCAGEYVRENRQASRASGGGQPIYYCNCTTSSFNAITAELPATLDLTFNIDEEAGLTRVYCLGTVESFACLPADSSSGSSRLISLVSSLFPWL